MTTATITRAPDWKVTTGYRLLLRAGWGALALAVYGAVLALALGVPGAWWMAAGPASLALLVVMLLPEPVPAEMITGRKNRIDSERPAD
jgi:ABC-type spermidine/putrescine transport system permease subunit I